MKELTTEEIGKALKALPPGKSFTVSTEGERRMALVVAKATSKRITSRKNDKGGFQIIALDW